MIRLLYFASVLVIVELLLFFYQMSYLPRWSCTDAGQCSKVILQFEADESGVVQITERLDAFQRKAGSLPNRVKKTKLNDTQGVIEAQDCGINGRLHKKDMNGRLNVHIWYSWCGLIVDDLRRHPAFPWQPSARASIKRFATKKTFRVNLGKRIFGYIHPPKTGSYKFAISSDDSSELWISSSDDPINARIIAYIGEPDDQFGGATAVGQFYQFDSQISGNISLKAGVPYFIEAYHKQKGGAEHVEVAWQIPGKTELEIISSEYLSKYMVDNKVPDNHTKIKREICLTRRDPSVKFRFNKYLQLQKSDIRDDYFVTAPVLDHSEVEDALEKCSYRSQYLPTNDMEQFAAHTQGYIRRSKVFPNDNTDIHKINSDQKDGISVGNEVIPDKEARGVVFEYMKALQAKKGNKYELNNIIHIESRPHHQGGARYLVELDLREKGKDKSVRLSEYIYRTGEGNGTKLCYPKGFQWRKDVSIYMVITVMNYGKWIKDLVEQLSEFYRKGADRNFYLVIVDFNSTDINMKEMLENSGIKDRYFLLTKYGPFYKTKALNEGVALVKDPHSIIFTMDLHLKLPANIFDAIRKHTIEGLTLFVPKLIKLKCGFSVQYAQGGWDTYGYGLLGIYKADWDRIGGMNEKEFKHKWGGEDWEIMDRALGAHLEAERICLPKLYHLFHSREQDWHEDARL